MSELVSIVMPTFNRAHLLSRAIESVLNQTYDKWELIIVDDASTDHTADEIKSFSDGRIQYHCLEKNSGAPVARNLGIKKSRGEFVTFLDSDDEYLPEKVRLQVEQFKISNVANVGVVGCGREDFRDGKKYFQSVPKHKGNILRRLLMKKKVGAGTPFLMVRRHLLIRFNISFDPNMPASQDWDFMVQICMHSNFDFVPKPLVKVHHHSGERIYRPDTALRAFQLQYQKYGDLLKKDEATHRQFLLKQAALHFSYDDRDTAMKILGNTSVKGSLIAEMWKTYFKAFKNAKSTPSKTVLKVLNHLTFS